MSTIEIAKETSIYVAATDAKDILEGLVSMLEDTLHRDMEFGREKVALSACIARSLSIALTSIIDRADVVEHRSP